MLKYFENTPDQGTAGSVIQSLTTPSETGTTASVTSIQIDNTGFYRGQARQIHEEFDRIHQELHLEEWVNRTNRRGRQGTAELLAEIADLGFAWRDIAKLIGVSVPAIQKWRRGERITGANRRNVAGLLAACDLISERYHVQEVASWFEVPISPDAPVTPMELWADGCHKLVFDFASSHSTATQTLDSWNPEWRERYRSNFEVFMASDGQLSIRETDG
ncbi:hypothetical protein K3N28_19300 [Glycomyces sp. TRM65418]|uniref:hypothetical protein n=1 Tax=Glycomyces sp. TRM65418 TaxID=2867006 RepID=UPI001CE5B166|nr:hypothetical protein [Glycomyces sp. TRM65418]MCC3765208.1 hypothetical protein [Glycomyces sp. TRM65418]QZD54833.1 hypothetical protein K3N28_19205 [Glycomyces sp. TRM65418]